MFFRFGAAITLLVLIALAGIALEKRNLSRKQSLSLQVYRFDQLQDEYAKLRLRTQQLGAPARLLDDIEQSRAKSPRKVVAPKGTTSAAANGRRTR